MKKVLITFVAFLTTLNIMAQDLLTFKGIPIEGSLAEFKKKLKTNDFIWVGQENNISMFSGTFPRAGIGGTVRSNCSDTSFCHQKHL